MVAVGPRIGEYVDSPVANLHRECIGVRVRRDREVAMRTSVAAAPDLGLVRPWRGTKQRQTGVCEVRWAFRRPPFDLSGTTAEPSDDDAHGGRACRWPPRRRLHQRCPCGEKRGPAVDRRWVDQQRPPSSPSPWRGEPPCCVEDGGCGVQHRRRGAPRSPGRADGHTASHSTAARSAELGDESVILRGLLTVEAAREGVAGAARPRAGDAALTRHFSLSSNQSKAQLATSCPAASAITWLLADEPRLLKAARYCWCQYTCSRASTFASNSAAAPCQPSRRRRIHTQEMSRSPSSMPLVQWMPERKGFSAHHDAAERPPPRRRRSSPLANQAPASTVRCWSRDSSHSLLDVAGLSLGPVVDAEGVFLVRRSPPGDRVKEPVGVGEVRPHHPEHLPPSLRAARRPPLRVLLEPRRGYASRQPEGSRRGEFRGALHAAPISGAARRGGPGDSTRSCAGPGRGLSRPPPPATCARDGGRTTSRRPSAHSSSDAPGDLAVARRQASHGWWPPARRDRSASAHPCAPRATNASSCDAGPCPPLRSSTACGVGRRPTRCARRKLSSRADPSGRACLEDLLREPASSRS